MKKEINEIKVKIPLAVPIKTVLLSTADAAIFLVVSTVVCTVLATVSTNINKTNYIT